MKCWSLIVLMCFATTLAFAQSTARHVACASCKGTGRSVQHCVACEGRQQRPCPDCTPVRHEVLTTGDPERDAKLARIEAALRKLDAERAQLDAWVRTPGRVLCPARCTGGKVFLRADECKYCKGKAGIACRRCKSKGDVKCSVCTGRGRYERACDDCLGLGRLLDPSSIADDQRGVCSWCSGRTVRECVECARAATTKSVCRDCDGARKLVCAKCVGSGDMPCKACSASGKQKDLLGSKTSVECEACETTGRVGCDTCTTGLLTCKSCNGQGNAIQACSACNGLRVRPCAGCNAGRYRHWEIAVELLVASGQDACAVEFLELARARIDPCFERRLKELGGSDLERDALAKERLSEHKRLEQRLAALKRKQP